MSASVNARYKKDFYSQVKAFPVVDTDGWEL